MGLRIAIFGQAAFGRDAALAVAEAGHQVVGVFAPPAGSRPDPLAELAIERGWPLVRHRHFRRKGEAIAERVDEYRAVGADLNLMPFTTVFLPPEIVAAPEHGSLCFHPSLLPAFRGGAAPKFLLNYSRNAESIIRLRQEALPLGMKLYFLKKIWMKQKSSSIN